MAHKPITIQVRLNATDDKIVLEHLDSYLTDKHMIYCHEPGATAGSADGPSVAPGPSRRHYHIYIWGVYRQPKAIREFLERMGYPKTDYMVGTTAGKERKPITEQLAYQYGMKPSSNPRIVQMKGFTDDQLQLWKEMAEKYYAKKTVVERVVIEQTTVKPDLVWQRFYEKMLRTPESITWTKDMFRKWIMADYLSRAKPVPRQADLHRYSYSLYMLRDKRDPDGYTFEIGDISSYDYV